MKRYIAVLVFGLVVLSQIFCASAGDVTVINGMDTYNQVEGEGFHDVKGEPYGKKYETWSPENACIIQHAGDWGAYDVSALQGGTYLLKITAGTSANIKYQVQVDGKIIMAAGNVGSSGGYNVMKQHEVGQMYIPEGTQYLKLMAVGGSAFLQSFSLEFLDSENLTLITEKEIGGTDVLPGGEGIGFHDTSDKAAIEKGYRTQICLRNGEWAAYDVSMFRPGLYRVSCYLGCKAAPGYQIEVDGAVALSAEEIPATGSYEVQEWRKLGNLRLDGTQKVLKLYSSVNASYLEFIKLQRLEPIACEGMNGNVGMVGGLLPRGTDRLTVSFNNKLAAESVTAEHFQILNPEGENVPVVVLPGTEATEVILDLLESLEYSSGYTIVVRALTDEDNQHQEGEIRYRFQTADAEDTAGVRKLADVLHARKDRTVRVEGCIVSSANRPMGNQPVELYIQAPDKTSATKVSDTLSSGDEKSRGSFSLSYTLPDGAAAGKYTYYIGNEYISENERYRDNFYYYDSELDKTIAEAFHGCKTAEEVQSALDLYQEYLGVDLESVKKTIDFNYVLLGMTEREFKSTEQVSKALQMVVCLEQLNQAAAESAVQTLLENDGLRGLFQIDEEAWGILAAEEKQKVYSAIFELKRYVDETDLRQTIDAAVYEMLRVRLELEKPALLVNTQEIDAGETAEISMGFSERQSFVKTVELRFEYSMAAGELYEADEEISFISDIKNIQVASVRNDGQICIRMDWERPAAVSGELGRLRFSAPGSIAGTYPASVSGFVDYAADTLKENLVISIPMAGKDISVKVGRKQESGGKYYGGGGVGGGKSYAASDAAVPSAIDNNQPQQQEYFHDLQGYDWAKEAICALKERGIIAGRSETEFAPHEKITRAEICKLAVLALGYTIDDGGGAFEDVPADAWYCPYVAKAAAENLVQGNENYFFPEIGLSRQDLAVIIYRALSAKNVILQEEKGFADDGLISDYAKKAVHALFAAGLINGMEENRFCPQETVTRAMAAKMIDSMMQKLA